MTCKLPANLIEKYRCRELTIRQVCEAADVCWSTARKYLAKAGVAIRRNGPVQFEIHPDAVRAYVEGRTTCERIAAALGVHRASVHRRLRELGVFVPFKWTSHVRKVDDSVHRKALEDFAARRISVAEARKALGGISRQRVYVLASKVGRNGTHG